MTKWQGEPRRIECCPFWYLLQEAFALVRDRACTGCQTNWQSARPGLADDGDSCLVDGVFDQHLDGIGAAQAFLADVELDDAVIVFQVGAGAHGQMVAGSSVHVVGTGFLLVLQKHHGQRPSGKAAVEDNAVHVFLDVHLILSSRVNFITTL